VRLLAGRRPRPSAYAAPVTAPALPVDVVVVTWNTRELTLAALGRVLASASDESLRVVVHDNASTDGTAAAIAKQLPEVELEAGDVNLGFAGGVNRALRRTSAPWVLLLNSDAWPEPGAVAAMVACAQRHPQAAAVAPRLLRPDDTLEHSTWPLPSWRVAASSALRAGRYVWPHDAEREVGWAVGAALLLRRDALAEVGPLDETLFMYAEDLDWCWRARAAGWQIWFTPQAVVRHVGNASGEQRFGDGRDAAWINNSVRVYRHHRRLPATLGWRCLNAAGAVVASRRASRAGHAEAARAWRHQAAAWLRPAHDDRLPT
jgi:N-acetylglucosaminyl-diphospho-decaprenol L-rhamnosyltransferase